jgi:hypothetical protein
MAPTAIVITFAGLFLLRAYAELAVMLVAMFPGNRRPHQDYFTLLVPDPRTTRLSR